MRFWAASLVFLFHCALAAERLPGYGADVATFTVSGLSSGGYMAVQMQVAHSSRVSGVGALAAGPYYCAQGSLWRAMNHCMTPGWWTPLPDLQTLKGQTERLAQEKRIDSPAALSQARVWLFAGTQDRTVKPEVVDALAKQYAAFGAKPLLIADKPAGHGMVVEQAENPCSVTEPPFINDCDYDAAGELLRHLLGSLAAPAAKPAGELLPFDQNEFVTAKEFVNAKAMSMAAAGYVYVPKSCASERCRVHVAFHGCRQGSEAVGQSFVRDAGYNRWADTNRLIVLYPQAIARYAWWTFNPRGCWDWWGYTGPDYATKSGAQIRAVLAMVDRLGSPSKEKNR